MKRKADKKMRPYHRCRYIVVVEQPDGSWAYDAEFAFYPDAVKEAEWIRRKKHVRIVRYGQPTIVYDKEWKR